MSYLMDRIKNVCGKIVDKKSHCFKEEEKLLQREKQMVSEGCPNTNNVILDSQEDTGNDLKRG